MNQEKNRKLYLVFSVAALAVLMAGAVSVSSSNNAISANSLADTETTQEIGNQDTNDGLSVSDGDGETSDDSTNDGLSVSDGDGETADDNQ